MTEPGVCEKCGWPMQSCDCLDDEHDQFTPYVDGCAHGIGFDETCEICEEIEL